MPLPSFWGAVPVAFNQVKNLCAKGFFWGRIKVYKDTTTVATLVVGDSSIPYSFEYRGRQIICSQKPLSTSAWFNFSNAITEFCWGSDGSLMCEIHPENNTITLSESGDVSSQEFIELVQVVGVYLYHVHRIGEGR